MEYCEFGNLYTKWTNFTCKKARLYHNSVFERLNLRFGYAITDVNFDKVIAKATSKIEPVFDSTNDVPTSYQQNFSDDITIHMLCGTEPIHKTQFISLSFDEGKYHYYLKMNCPDAIHSVGNNLY